MDNGWVIVNDNQRRAMEFIATANRGGYRPTGREINQWRLQPDPKPARKGRLLEPGVPGTPDRRVWKASSPLGLATRTFLAQSSSYERMMKQFSSSTMASILALSPTAKQNLRGATRAVNAAGWLDDAYEVIPGTPSKPAVYAPDKPPEKFLAHLCRLGWIARDSRARYSVTLLGQALLAADVEDANYEDSSVILLSKDDELAYARVLGAIGGCGNALVVDAYLSSEALSHILTHTNASRFLVNHRFQPDRLTELRVLIAMCPPNDDGVARELRQADFHERYLIGEDRVYSLTASLNGVGKHSALLSEMGDIPARAVRAEVEDLWREAKVLSRGRESADVVEDDDEAAAGLSKKVIRIEDDRYLHDGCNVRHRKRESADNCTNGS